MHRIDAANQDTAEFRWGVRTRALYRARLRESESVSDHLQKMCDLFSQFSKLGEDYSEQQKVYIILSSLNKSWDSLVLTLEALPEQQGTMQYLTGRSLTEVSKHQESKELTPQCNPRSGRRSGGRNAAGDGQHSRDGDGQHSREAGDCA